MSGLPLQDDRLISRFDLLRRENRGGLVTFITAGDPDFARSCRIMKGLPGAGADFIELGMPFTDPMADGPSIQASALRSLKGGHTMALTLSMVEELRKEDVETPVILMGYYNPIYSYGVARFLKNAKAAGVDGLIVVDLPPEEDAELCLPALEAGVHFIRLATPTTNASRLPTVLKNTTGFLYYVSITGITGAGTASTDKVKTALQFLRPHTDLPIAVGFGIKTPEQAADVARHADAAVVGSALVEKIAESERVGGDPVGAALMFVKDLSSGIRAARRGAKR
ncbi:MAG: tryptophan synthase subunit alpha [Rhodospirillaceae bacterium]|nr:tryptophan synthase subunit alpha [Rhodospirillaceae bacterium]